jgi:hypothetical protein
LTAWRARPLLIKGKTDMSKLGITVAAMVFIPDEE